MEGSAEKRRLKIIACAVLENEIKAAAAITGVQITEEYLSAGLHEEPERLRKELQQAIDNTTDDFDAIVIGYGLCGRGTIGVRAGRLPLILPRVHDCIAMFLGSHDKYREQFTKNPGTLYMTEGWYEHKTQPLSVKKKKKQDFEGNWDIHTGYEVIQKKYGRENADEIYDFLNTWKRNYNRSVYIDTGAEKSDVYENYARDLASELGWKYERIEGGTGLFEAMLNGRYSDDEILIVPPLHMTTYDPLKQGLHFYNPDCGAAELWERRLPDGGAETEPAELKSNRQGLGLGIDAGGTYTDAVVYDFDTETVISKAKAPTTKWDFTLGITGALKKIEPQLLEKVRITVVSTTLATNAIVEDRGRKVGLLLMPLGDIPAGKIEHSPWRIINGRLSITGDELEPINEAEIRQIAAEMITGDGVEAFAVSGYGSTANSVHELQVKRIIEAETGLGVCCGHELSNTLNFFVRANTAVLNAGIIPLLEQFIEELERSLESLNISGSVMIVRGDGSLMSREKAVLHPIETTLSGPAASIAGANYLVSAKTAADAVVIDVGGTTSDIGTIVNGRIRLDEEGAMVGRWRTHLKAVNMFTLGAGGDSRILIDNHSLQVGPRRVAPFGRLSDVERYEEAVQYIEELHSDYFSSTEAMEILAVTGRKPGFNLSYDEQQILNVLNERPHSVKELAVKLKHGLWRILNPGRLEAAAVIQRYGLTPTDLLAAEGLVNLWPGSVSGRVSSLYRLIWGDDSGPLKERVFGFITDNLLKTLLLQELDVSGDSAESVASENAFRALLENLKGNSGALRLSPSLRGSLIGVGAAAAWLLPGLAEHLQAELIVPEDGDVANAVGAVCSMVTVRRAASVVPAADGRFIVNGIDEPQLFDSFDEGCDFLEEKLAEAVKKEAVLAGTDEKRIIWAAENRMTPASDGNYVFLGRDYTAEITGLPSLI